MKPGRKPASFTQPGGGAEPNVPGIQPDPPAELSPDEAKEWNRFWEVSPPNWFPKETWPLLAQLCRHICHARFLGEALQEFRVGLLDPKNPKDLAHLNQVAVMHDREGRAMGTLMDKLRLSTQQRVATKVAGAKQEEAAPEVRPWMAQGRDRDDHLTEQ